MNEQIISKIILTVILFFLGLSLFVLPIVYSIWRGNWGKSFRFTWLLWAVVIFVFGFFLPAIGRLQAKATGEFPDANGFVIIMGIMFGWLPGGIFASIGTWIHDLIWKRKKVLDTE